MSGHTVWIGGLPKGVKDVDVEEFLIQYAIGHGKLLDVQIRSSPRDIFAFATFANLRDADDAVRDLHQTEFLESNHFVKMERAGNKEGHGDSHRDVRERRSPPRGYDRSRSRSRRGDRRRDDSRDRHDHSNDRPPSHDRPLTLWMGGLPRNVQEDEIEDFCKGYGRILQVRIRQSERDVFAFVDFEDAKRAKLCLKELNQKEWFGQPRLVIQVRESFTERPARDLERQRGAPPPKLRQRNPGNYTVELRNLPPNMPWFELKDIAREIGSSVSYTSIFKRDSGTHGVVEYVDIEDAKRLCDELDGRRFSGYPERVEAIRLWE